MSILKAKLLGWGRQKGAKHGYPKFTKQPKTPTGVHFSKESQGQIKHKFLKRNDIDKFGKGAIVRVKKQFGINDVPVGTKGVVVGHVWGKDSPEIMFEGIDRNYAPSIDSLELVQGSSKFTPRNTEEILLPKSKEAIIEKLHEYNRNYPFIHWYNHDSFSGNIYLDDGEGRTDDATFHGKVKDGKVEVKLNKNDVPSYWRDIYHDNLFEEAVDKVKDALDLE